jgi:hypothetical protein
MLAFHPAVTWDPGKSPWIGAASFIPEPSTKITQQAIWGISSGWPFLFLEKIMTKQQKQLYQDVKSLKQIIQRLNGQKFRLDCGHHITFGYHLGNNIIIINGKIPKIICSLCGY